MKYFVKYALPYVHHVVVGVEADSVEDAREKVRTAFDDGALWTDTPAMPVLHDSYEEGMWDGSDSPVLEFEVQAWPQLEFPAPRGPFMVPEYRCEHVIDFDGEWLKE